MELRGDAEALLSFIPYVDNKAKLWFYKKIKQIEDQFCQI
jgi:hypothetical protein